MTEARILIVEDDNIIAMELVDRLQGLGYSVCGQAASGEDAVARAGRLRPDLILMDIRLKGEMDGVEAAMEIRERFDIPVVYLTAYADANTLQRAKITEPYGYILKPFEEKELHTAIEIGLYKHRMEARLRQSEQWLSTTLRSIGDAVIATNELGRIVFMNPVAETLTSWPQEDALGQPGTNVFQVISEETRSVIENPIVRALREGKALSLANHLLVTRNGQEIPIDGSAALIQDGRGVARGIVLAFQDISDRRRQEMEREKLQAQLFQAQKMEAIGMLAGGIAHDFNNLMTTVIGSSSLMIFDLPEEAPLREGLERIKYAGQKAAALTKQILALSRDEMPEPQILDFDAVVIDIEEMLERLISEDVHIIHSLEPGYKYVKADPAQLEQVIMNLMINAHEAMPEGGTLTIETRTKTRDRIEDEEMLGERAGVYICLSVTDTGIGMDEATVEHIFDPFYTTKPKGSGLGLSIAYNIVSQYGGWIDVSSQFGQGTTFDVYLPAFLADAELEGPESVSPSELQGDGERILLVEDDEGVRAAVSQMLLSNGYALFEAPNAARALDLFDERAGELNLLLSDVVLPDQDGIQLVEQCLRKRPDLPVLLTSGYTDHRSQWLLIRERGYCFLQKPFGMAELLRAVHEALEAGRPAQNE